MSGGRLKIDLRLLGAGLVAATLALVVLLVTSPPDRTAVVIADADLPAGVPLGELDVASRQVLDAEGLVVAEAIDGLRDHVLVAPLEAGSPIPASLLAASQADRGADLLGIDLASAAAVHGWLRAGDLVDVYAVGPEVTLIAPDVAVVDVAVDSTSLGSGSAHLILAVNDELGAALLAVIGRGADLHLVRKAA